jgi:hypothetical protein
MARPPISRSRWRSSPSRSVSDRRGRHHQKDRARSVGDGTPAMGTGCSWAITTESSSGGSSGGSSGSSIGRVCCPGQWPSREVRRTPLFSLGPGRLLREPHLEHARHLALVELEGDADLLGSAATSSSRSAPACSKCTTSDAKSKDRPIRSVRAIGPPLRDP